MFAAVAGAIRTLESGPRRRIYLLVPLALLNAVLEAVGAAAIYVLVRVVTAPDSVAKTPVLSNYRNLLSGLNDDQFVVVLGASIAVFYVVKNLSLLFESFAQAKLANDAAAAGASRLLAGYFSAPWAFHFQRNSAELIRNTTVSVDIVYRSVLLSGTSMVSDSMIVLGMLVVLVSSAPIVTPLAAGTLGFFLFVTFKLTTGRFRRWGAETQDLSTLNLQTLQHSLGAMKEIKLLGREAHFEQEFAVGRRRLAGVFWRSATALQFPRLAMETIFVLVMVVVVSIVTFQTGGQDKAVALLGLYAYAGFRLLPSVNRIVNSAANIRLGEAAVDIVRDDLASTASFERLPDVAPLPFEREVRLESVSFRYPTSAEDVLRDIDLVVRRGAMVGVMGATGSGKSTLVDLLMGVLEPTAGRVLVDGVDIRTNVRSWQRSLGYVSQSTFLHEGSLRENIALGVAPADIDDDAVERAATLALLDDVLATLPGGFDGPIGERGVRLSGGQRQRIAIARALYHDPAVLVFDEATSSLDNRTAGDVTRAIVGLAGSRTLLVIAHRIESVRMCESVVFLADGRIVDQGSFDELVARSASFRRTIDHLEEDAHDVER